MTLKLEKICEVEKVPYTMEGIDAIVETAQGDMRQAINNLQLTFNGYLNVVPDNVYKLCDKPHPLVIKGVLMACYDGDFVGAIRLLNDLREKGYSCYDISHSMFNSIKNGKIDINEQSKIDFMKIISNTCSIVSKGVNTPLQLSSCIALLCDLQQCCN